MVGLVSIIRSVGVLQHGNDGNTTLQQHSGRLLVIVVGLRVARDAVGVDVSISVDAGIGIGVQVAVTNLIVDGLGLTSSLLSSDMLASVRKLSGPSSSTKNGRLVTQKPLKTLSVVKVGLGEASDPIISASASASASAIGISIGARVTIASTSTSTSTSTSASASTSASTSTITSAISVRKIGSVAGVKSVRSLQSIIIDEINSDWRVLISFIGDTAFVGNVLSVLSLIGRLLSSGGPVPVRQSRGHDTSTKRLNILCNQMSPPFRVVIQRREIEALHYLDIPLAAVEAEPLGRLVTDLATGRVAAVVAGAANRVRVQRVRVEVPRSVALSSQVSFFCINHDC